MRRRMRYAALLTLTMLAAAGCGSDGTSAGSGDAGSGGGGPTLTITSPADGATVSSPVKLTFQASSELGPPDSGKDHVHVFADGKTDQYTVVPSDTFELKDLGPGQHTIGVTLQHADHSPAGASAEVTVMVTGSGQPAPGGAPPATDYGY